MELVDCHTHSLHSDGELTPAELFRRAEEKQCRALILSDHVDFSNLSTVIPAVVRACEKERLGQGLTVLPGAELTHILPAQIPEAVELARAHGARVVLVHGETIVEPVRPGTNRAAIRAGIDILAHPGLISPREARLAAERGVRLEISGRCGHSLTNGWVVKLARAAGASLVFGSDAHGVSDFVTPVMAERVVRGAGVEEPESVFRNAWELFKSKYGKARSKAKSKK